MSFSARVCVGLAWRIGTAEAEEKALFKRARQAEGPEPVAAAALGPGFQNL